MKRLEIFADAIRGSYFIQYPDEDWVEWEQLSKHTKNEWLDIAARVERKLDRQGYWIMKDAFD